MNVVRQIVVKGMVPQGNRNNLKEAGLTLCAMAVGTKVDWLSCCSPSGASFSF